MNELSESLRKEYGRLYEQVRDIVNDEDPIDLIRGGVHTDKYDQEISMIMIELKECRSVDRLQASIHRIFIRNFDLTIAGSTIRYRRLALRLCKLMNIPAEKPR
jgi:hypothetical protein